MAGALQAYEHLRVCARQVFVGGPSRLKEPDSATRPYLSLPLHESRVKPLKPHETILVIKGVEAKDVQSIDVKVVFKIPDRTQKGQEKKFLKSVTAPGVSFEKLDRPANEATGIVDAKANLANLPIAIVFNELTSDNSSRQTFHRLFVVLKMADGTEKDFWKQLKIFANVAVCKHRQLPEFSKTRAIKFWSTDDPMEDDEEEEEEEEDLPRTPRRSISSPPVGRAVAAASGTGAGEPSPRSPSLNSLLRRRDAGDPEAAAVLHRKGLYTKEELTAEMEAAAKRQIEEYHRTRVDPDMKFLGSGLNEVDRKVDKEIRRGKGRDEKLKQQQKNHDDEVARGRKRDRRMDRYEVQLDQKIDAGVQKGFLNLQAAFQGMLRAELQNHRDANQAPKAAGDGSDTEDDDDNQVSADETSEEE